MTSLKRITTEYVPTEDRFRLRGERSDDSTALVLWLTHRLLVRVLPVMLKWLEQGDGELPQTSALQDFAQHAARSTMKPQPPVQISATTDDWLINSVDVGSNEKIIRVTFKAAEDQSVYLAFTSQQLRQWLSIVHNAWRKAEWPEAVWPSWVQENHVPPSPQATVLH